MASPSTRTRALGLLLVSLVLVGCGAGTPVGADPKEKRVKVTGRLLKNGLPLKPDTSKPRPPGDTGIQLIFVRIGDAQAGKEYRANYDVEAGTFDVPGDYMDGIPPAKYRAVVMIAPFGSDDELKGKYSKEKSKLEYEIDGTKEIAVEIQ